METVIKCSEKGKWQDKTIYLIEMSNGTKGDSFQEIPIGTADTELTFTPNANPNYAAKVKWNQAKSSFGGGSKVKAGNESFALSYAKDMAVAHITKGDKPEAMDSAAVLKVAEAFYVWLESKKK